MVDISNLLTLYTDEELQIGDLVYSPFPMASNYLKLTTPVIGNYSKATYKELAAILSPDVTNVSYSDVVKETNLAARFWSCIAYANGIWIATSGGHVSNTSAVFSRSIDNGETWTSVAAPVQGGWTGIAYGNGVWVAVCLRNSSNAVTTNCATSHDNGLTWTLRAMPVAANWADVTYGNGVFVAVAGGAVASTTISAWSTDGITWNSSVLPVSGYWGGIAYGGGAFVAVNAYGQIGLSYDGKVWKGLIAPNPNTGMNQIAYGNGVFISVAGGGHVNGNVIFISKNHGVTWTQGALPSNQNWGGIAYGAGVWATVAGYYSASTSIIATSDNDGTTWTQRTLPTSQQWVGIGSNKSRFIAVPHRTSTLAATSIINIVDYAVNPTTFVLPTTSLVVKNSTPYIKALNDT